ncbi:unnamed protein product [Orchesella dallaii]|uniref:Inner centromere protein ARK-binding domain-containing protein n=1 Tax=Orchesella dallaii TaxID=48710 RepID=A0ABP1RCQ5_9HEXA
MPCTRSMVTRSVSKPSTKKNGRAADEEEMPPPPTSPPKARPTRSKKVIKQSSQEVTTSKSSGSTRSTRSRAHSKADQAVEVESNPPSPRPSRSTRQKPSTASKAKSAVAKQLSKQVVDVESDSDLSPKPLPVATTSKSALKSKTEGKTAASTSKGPTKRTRARTKKLESETEDASTDAEIDKPKRKNLTLEQLHKHHVLPLKTALSVCEAFPKIIKKIAETDTIERMQNEFQQLMNSEDMLPPPVPASTTKGKGRKKRNRSPEVPTSKTDLPMSFNFAENKEDAPANKKMIVDAPTPEIESKTMVSSKKGTTELRSGESSEQETDSAEVELLEKEDKEKELPQKPHPSKVVEKKIKKTKTKRVKKVKEESSASDQEKASSIAANDDRQEEQAMTVDPKPDNQKGCDSTPDTENSTPAIVHVELDKQQSSDFDKDLKSKSEQDGAKSGTILSSMDSEEALKNCHTDPEPKSMHEVRKNDVEKSISPINKLEVDENNIKQTNITPEVCASSNGITSKIQVNDNDVNTTHTAETKKKPMLEETFVFDTPKEDAKEKTTKLNTTFTPELQFSETPKSSRPQQILNETVVISKDSSPACVNETDEDHILAPESPDSANINSANGKVHSLVKYFDKQTDKSKISHDCKADSTEKIETNDDGTPVENNPNATFVLPPTKKDNHPNPLMNVTVCVKKAGVPDSIKEDSFLPTQKLNVNPTSESAASRTFVKEAPSLTVVLEEEDEKIARLSKQNDTNRAAAKPSKDVNKGISSSSSSSGCSMKSAVSQPCLTSKHKVAASSIKNGPSHGSTGKLHDVHKSKPLEEAERRRQELLNLKVEQQKKKNEEWRKKAEKNNLEEAKKQKEKAKAIQTASSTSNIIKKPHQFAKPNIAADLGLASGFQKPKTVFGSSSKVPPIGAIGGSKVLPSFPKAPFQKQAPPPPPNDHEIDDSFKSASTSFLDGTMEGHLSSYDITVYEDLDEDLKHRENKTIPKWASDKDALKEALFSMVLLSEYQYKISSGFPKPDKNYRLFPNKNY